MIEIIPNLPENVIGFSAKGKVTAKDYESVLIPAVESAFERNKKLRCLYLLGDEFSEFETEAMWDDAKVGLKHITGWEKIALVTDIVWMRMAFKAFGLIIPGELRVFSNSEFEKAKSWIAESSVGIMRKQAD